MTDTEKTAVYKAFGLRVLSEVPLPELTHMDDQEGGADVRIEVDDLSGLWSELAASQRNFVVDADLTMFQIANTATFLVTKGDRIIVSPMQGADEDKMRLYILGTCMGALLMQRKVLPLHGSAVAIDGKAYGIIGERGAGKSTLAAAFLKRGCQLLSDDVIAVSFSDSGIPMVTPSYPQQKLWQESLEAFGMDTGHYQPLFERETKYAVPVHAKYSDQPFPLAGVFELIKSEIGKIEIQPIPKLASLYTIYCHTYRNFIIPRSGLMQWHFDTSVNIVDQTQVWQLRRPTGSFTASELASLIFTTLNKEGRL